MPSIKYICLAAAGALIASWTSPQALAAGITFACGDSSAVNTMAFDGYATSDPNNQGFSGSLCSTIQSTVGGAYASLFTNANASIYIEFVNTPDTLGGSTSGDGNFVTYSQYRTALFTHSSGDAVDTAATASLPSNLPNVFPSGTGATPYPADVSLTSALASALGLSGSLITGPNSGIEADGSTTCTIGDSGCYNGFIELGSPSELQTYLGEGYYYGTGTQQSNEYDIFSVIEHETDEILGTASCIGTTTGSLVNDCGLTYTQNGQTVGTVPGVAAVDLFRYTASGTRAGYPTTDAAYFSYDGGVTNVASYNHAANGMDYADFSANCQFVQDAQGCLGSAQLITSDGGAEATILDAVGYNLVSATPEPATFALFGSCLALLALAGFRRRRA